MSYCNKFKIEPSVAQCLACEHCLPPGERVEGRMCPHEELQKSEIKIMMGGQVVGLSDKPIHIITESYTMAAIRKKAVDTVKSWEISAQAMIQEPGDMLRELLDDKHKFDVTITRTPSHRLPRKMKKAYRSDYRRNTKWVRRIDNYIRRNMMRFVNVEVKPHADGILFHRGIT